jgi:branched-chain amino acid transport system ATP-binding protein
VRSEAGVVELNGRDVTRASAAKRARQGLARTFQAPLVPVQLSVGEALAAARLAWSPPASRGDSARVRELVDFRPADDVRCGALSTLDRRKLLLVCLLIRAPSVLLLDEPCSGLLEDEIGEIDRIIVSLVAAGGLAVVVVEHRLELLFSIAGRVVVLDEGREIAHGPPAEVFAAPAVREAYFEAEPAAAQQ